MAPFSCDARWRTPPCLNPLPHTPINFWLCVYNFFFSHTTLNSSAYLYILVFHNFWLKEIANAGLLTTKKYPKNNGHQTRFTRHPVAVENEHNFMCLLPFVTWMDKEWSNCWNNLATHHTDVHGHQIYVCNVCMYVSIYLSTYLSIYLFVYGSDMQWHAFLEANVGKSKKHAHITLNASLSVSLVLNLKD